MHERTRSRIACRPGSASALGRTATGYPGKTVRNGGSQRRTGSPQPCGLPARTASAHRTSAEAISPALEAARNLSARRSLQQDRLGRSIPGLCIRPTSSAILACCDLGSARTAGVRAVAASASPRGRAFHVVISRARRPALRAPRSPAPARRLRPSPARRSARLTESR